MKICNKCNKSKGESCFYGVQGECKECTKLRVKLNLQKVGSTYDFSECGVIRVIYKTQKRNNKLRGHGEMAYTKSELSEWLYASGFKGLFDKWVGSGHVKNLKPSVDRIGDYKGYSLDNILLSTWMKNKQHQYNDITTGVGTSGKRCKRLLKLDSDMSIVCEYVSYNSAARDIGYSVEHQIKKKVKCRNGFYWSYA